MIFCHQCQRNVPSHPRELRCRLCGCEAVQVVEDQSAPFSQFGSFNQSFGFGFGSERQSIPRNSLFSMMRPSINMQSSFMPFNFPMMEMIGSASMMGRPQFTTIIIMDGENQEQVSKPVDKETMNKFNKIQNLSHDCAICQQKQGHGIKLTCGHQFHHDCINPWFQNKNSCPCCRQTF